MTDRHITPEPQAAHGFRRMISVAKIGQAGLVQKIAANPSEYRKIADYLELAGIGSLSAEVSLARWRDKGIRVTGKLKADITQTCVVTLEPVPAHVEAEFERRFLPDDTARSDTDAQREVFVDPEGEDPPEPLGREIDLGEILIEELSLNLDPYPRKAGAVLAVGAAPEAPRPSPFAALAKLKSPRKPTK